MLDADGVEQSVANTDGGAGTPWFLLCTTKPLKPIILQKRKDFEFVAKDRLTDDNVFEQQGIPSTAPMPAPMSATASGSGLGLEADPRRHPLQGRLRRAGAA